MDRGSDIETIDIYDTKPLLQGDILSEKKFDAMNKLERPSPRRGPLHAERMSPMISTGTMAQGRGSPFG
jgi:hypothetical protein